MVARSYAIIGTGALGGYYGARLHHAGSDVHFLLHSDYEHVRAHGLRVMSKDGDFSIARPQAYAAARDLHLFAFPVQSYAYRHNSSLYYSMYYMRLLVKQPGSAGG